MFLRFIRLLMIIFFVFTLVTWPILLPIDAASVPDELTNDGLEKLSWSK
jgi:calcium permeable stress-gated cation channel